jgi:hypothetical protein
VKGQLSATGVLAMLRLAFLGPIDVLPAGSNPRAAAGGTRVVRSPKAALAALTGAFALAFAGAASADTLIVQGQTFKGDGHCVGGSAVLGHSTTYQGGQTNVEIWTERSVTQLPFDPCVFAWDRPTGWLSIKRTYFFWSFAQNQWISCRSSGWLYNQSPRNYLSNHAQYTSAPCGPGWYGVLQEGWTWENVGGWKGGSIWSSYHWMII